MMKWNQGASKISMKVLHIFSVNEIGSGLIFANTFAIGNISSVAQIAQKCTVSQCTECSITNPKTPFLSHYDSDSISTAEEPVIFLVTLSSQEIPMKEAHLTNLAERV